VKRFNDYLKETSHKEDVEKIKEILFTTLSSQPVALKYYKVANQIIALYNYEYKRDAGTTKDVVANDIAKIIAHKVRGQIIFDEIANELAVELENYMVHIGFLVEIDKPKRKKWNEPNEDE
jgi:hypothetical protein